MKLNQILKKDGIKYKYLIMGLINHIKDIFDDEKHLEENEIFRLLIFTPATIISSIISIPLTIIGIIFIPFGKTIQKFTTRILLFVQHGISMGHLYYLEEYIFDSLEYTDILVGGTLAIIAFYRTIKRLVDETMVKTFGE
tara:strand:- start:300 stop:719 length:420 start_codon:yes stop_codon:yes gene_type:complete